MQNNKPQELGRRSVIYIDPNTNEPYSEAKARYIDFWMIMGFDMTNPESRNLLSYNPCPEIVIKEVWLN